MYNCNTSLKYFPLQNPHNNLAITVVLNEKIFQTCLPQAGLYPTYFSK